MTRRRTALRHQRADQSTLGSWRWKHHAEILIMSFAALVIEISYTRVISFKIFYYYVFLVIGLALLGIGAGGVLVAISSRLRKAAIDLIMFWCFAFGSLATIACYSVIAWAPVNTLEVWRYGTSGSYKSFGLLLLVCLCIFSSFVAPGVMIATLFGRRPTGAGGIYFADLVGAGVGCAAVIYLVSSLGAPAAVMVAAAAMAAGAVWVSLRSRGMLRVVATLALAGAIVLTTNPGLLPAQTIDPSKDPPSGAVYSAWGSVFRVDASGPLPIGRPRHGFQPAVRLLFHDGILGSGIYAWNGKRSSLSAYDFGEEPISLPFSVLGHAPSEEAVIGAAGGHEVLASLFYGAEHIDAVELNPVTVNMVRDVFAGFDGHLAQNPAVDYITGDGWSFMARHTGKFNLVWYPAPDSYSATNAGLASANVLSESYLYTTNAVESMLRHTTANGVFVAQFGEVDDQYELRTARFVATARQALRDLGVQNPRDHILVAQTLTQFLGPFPLSTIIVKRAPFSRQQLAGFESAIRRIGHTRVLYSPMQTTGRGSVAQVVETPNAKLPSFYSSYPFNITPTTDNDPYFWHFARFGTVIDHFFQSLTSTDRENSVAERVLLLLVLVSIIAAILALLLPFIFVRREWSVLPRKGSSALYFAALGFGFIFFEITLMQELNLFLGYPTYAVTITLMALLVFTGLGALISQSMKHPATVPALLVVVALLTVFYLFGLTPLTNALLSAAMTLRVLVTLLVLAPLGLCLGMFMPLGVNRVAELGTYPREYVAWGWAVNGFASVVGSALATILAMAFGFDFVLCLGLAAYLVATAAWLLLIRPRGGSSVHSAAPTSRPTEKLVSQSAVR
jgi:hypothetical protein